MENPYKFDPTNHRVVTNMQTNDTKVYLTTAAIYGASLYLYSRRYLRVDGNGVAAGAFAAASLPAAYAYARFFMSDAESEAARMNNSREGKE
jgi:hypothetical protein